MKNKDIQFDNGAGVRFESGRLHSARLATGVLRASNKSGSEVDSERLLMIPGDGHKMANRIIQMRHAGATQCKILDETRWGGIGIEVEAFNLDGNRLTDAPEKYAIEALTSLGEGSSQHPVAGMNGMIGDYERLTASMAHEFGGGLTLSGTPIVGEPRDMRVTTSGPYGRYISETVNLVLERFIDPQGNPRGSQERARKHMVQLANKFDLNYDELREANPGALFSVAAGHVSFGIPTLSQDDHRVESGLAIAMSDVANSVLGRGPLEMMAAENPCIWGEVLPVRDARMALRSISRSTGDGSRIGSYSNYVKRIMGGIRDGVGNSLGRFAYPTNDGDQGLHAGTRLRVESPTIEPKLPTARVEHTGRSSAGPLATLAGNAYLMLVMQEVVLPAVASGQHPTEFWGSKFSTLQDHSSVAIADYVNRTEGSRTAEVLHDATEVLELAETNAQKRGDTETLRLVELARLGLTRAIDPQVASSFEQLAKRPKEYNLADTIADLHRRGISVGEITDGIRHVQEAEMNLIVNRQ